MEFSDNLVQFNIFKAMKHPTKDPSLFGNDVIDELVTGYMQLEAASVEFSIFVEDINVIDYFGSMIDESNYDELLMSTRSWQRLSQFGLGRDESDTVSVECRRERNRVGLSRTESD
ncbi:hypothetical protein CR513_24804, partial [Mucuna pruriens]